MIETISAISKRFADKIKCEQYRSGEVHQNPLSHVPDEVELNNLLRPSAVKPLRSVEMDAIK